jgi:hypothetical protein
LRPAKQVSAYVSADPQNDICTPFAASNFGRSFILLKKILLHYADQEIWIR